jgi:drug/metabolite transporter (DMT)-like permease
MPLFLTRGLKNFEYDVYLSWAVLEPILCLALLCSSLAFTLWVSSIKMLGVAKSSIFMSMIPVVTAVAGYLGGTEILSPVQWVGILIAVFGVVFSQWACKRAAGRKAKR